MNREIEQPRETGTGFLVVQVTTANSAIPLSGAEVTISRARDDGTDVLYELQTGNDGKTPRVSLPAPARGASQRPSSIPPFSTYNISVVLQGYEQAIYNEIPIFDGIIAMQQADLSPVPKNQYPDGFTVKRPNLFETTPPAL